MKRSLLRVKCFYIMVCSIWRIEKLVLTIC